MDYVIKTEDLKGLSLKRNTDAENHEVRVIISKWLNLDALHNKDLLVCFCWNAILKVVEAENKYPSLEGLDEEALSKAKNKLWDVINDWLQDVNADSHDFLIEYLLSSVAGLLQLAETGELSLRTLGGQAAELFVKKYLESEGEKSE